MIQLAKQVMAFWVLFVSSSVVVFIVANLVVAFIKRGMK